MNNQKNNVRGLDLARRFFEQEAKPAMEKHCPEVLKEAACGLAGQGSECFGYDDEYSRDHHWGPRVMVWLPDIYFAKLDPEIWKRVTKDLPSHFEGFEVVSGLLGGAGLEPEGISNFLMRAIGRKDLPATFQDWLDIPEEDFAHVVNGEVWHDGKGEFTKMRDFINGYYPDDVWKRRIAHWCRYASGMALYAMKRAELRQNTVYYFTAFGRTLKMTMELACMLNRTYFPYDKWLYTTFCQLENLAPEMLPLIEEATASDTSWKRRNDICEELHIMLDAYMVEIGLVTPHPEYKSHPTSGLRILERSYQELLKSVPEEILRHTPLWDQKFLEEFISGYVRDLSQEEWLGLLHLEPA